MARHQRLFHRPPFKLPFNYVMYLFFCIKIDSFIVIATKISQPTMTAVYPQQMDRSKPLDDLIAELKECLAADETQISTTFRDAYRSMIFFVSNTGTYDRFLEYDSAAIQHLTISLISVMTACSEHAPEQLEEMTRLWANTLDAVVRFQPSYESRSYQSWWDRTVRLFIAPPEWEDVEEEVRTQMITLVPALIETSSAYYVLQRLISEYYFDIGCDFNDTYVNCLTLGLSCFLRITHQHPKQTEWVTAFMIQQTKMNLSEHDYYEDPTGVRERYVFRVK